MTVSHLYFNGKTVDASLNYEQFKKNPDQFLGYEVKDPSFLSLLNAVALSTKASFDFSPTMDEVKHYVAKKKGQKPKDFAKYTITEDEKREAL